MNSTIQELKREVNIINLLNPSGFNFSLNKIYDISYSETYHIKYLFKYIPIGVYHKNNEIKNFKVYDTVKYISSNYDVIISGSVSLRLLGLSTREYCGDIDIIATQDVIDNMKIKYKLFPRPGYKSDLNLVTTFIINNIYVDVFLYNKQKYINIDNIKIHAPFELINTKLDMARVKDINDTDEFIKLIKNI